MHVDPYIVLGSAIVGLLVGVTGAGGGALMTPMLILIFGVTPSSAISSDLVAAVLMRPFGAAMHCARGRSIWNGGLDGDWLGADGPRGLVPAAPAGRQRRLRQRVELALGVALLVGSGAMVLRYVLDLLGAISAWRPIDHREAAADRGIGMVGGLIVGMTSVGSGSLMIVLLLFVYPLSGPGGWSAPT